MVFHYRHKSIIAYLSANNLSDAAAALRTELNLGEDAFDPATAKKYETLLEKKWTSIVRLQKKARYLPLLSVGGGCWVSSSTDTDPPVLMNRSLTAFSSLDHGPGVPQRSIAD